jgi:hypothetical protein
MRVAVQPEELFKDADSRSLQVERARNPDAALERLRAECLAFFDTLPEPPLYPRMSDPAREAAAQLLPKSTELLSRCIALGRDAQVGPQAAPLRDAIEAHAAALCFAADGRIRAAEEEWRRAADLERRVSSARRLWIRSDEAPLPVFDRSSGVSRFDARPEPMMTVKLACPSACQAVGEFSVSPRYASHRLTCVRCRAPFLAYVSEARSMDVSSRRGAKRYTFKVEEPDGAMSRVEFEDASGAEFNVARRDLVAFLYSSKRDLRAVLNLSNGRLLRIQRSGVCFVVTVAFGEDAPELATFRAYRDLALLPSALGSLLVRLYYEYGPGIARWLSRTPPAVRLARILLRWLYRRLMRRGYQ